MNSTLIARLIGATFGLVFVLVNAGNAVAPWSWILRVLGAVAFAGVILRIRRMGETEVEPRREAIGVYWLSVFFEVVVIVVGVRLLAANDRAEYGVALVAFVVGVHFLPFSWAFNQPAFLPLGLTLMILGSIGALLGLTGAGQAAIALTAGVASGFALMSYAVAKPHAASAGAPG
jgi:hypothetical protein